MGITRSERCVLACASLVAVTASPFARADDTIALTKAEVTALAVGKKVEFTRAVDGTVVAWDTRDDGRVFYAPPKARRAVVISGTYEITDDGALCFKWNNTDAAFRLDDGCVVFLRDAEKTRIVGQRNRERVIGTLVP